MPSDKMKSNIAGMWQRQNSNQVYLTPKILFLITTLHGLTVFIVYIKQVFMMVGLINCETIIVLPLSEKLWQV